MEFFVEENFYDMVYKFLLQHLLSVLHILHLVDNLELILQLIGMVHIQNLIGVLEHHLLNPLHHLLHQRQSVKNLQSSSPLFFTKQLYQLLSLIIWHQLMEFIKRFKMRMFRPFIWSDHDRRVILAHWNYANWEILIPLEVAIFVVVAAQGCHVEIQIGQLEFLPYHMPQFPQRSVPGDIYLPSFPWYPVVDNNANMIRIKNIQTLHPSLHILMHNLIGQQHIPFESTQSLKHKIPITHLLSFRRTPRLTNSQTQLHKSMHSFFHNLPLPAIIDDIQVKVNSEDLLNILCPNCMLVVVIYHSEMVIVTHQQLVYRLVHVHRHVLVLLHLLCV